MSEESEQPSAEVFETAFDWSETTPSNAVVETISAVSSREPTALTPLYESIDPDALDMLVQSTDEKDYVESVNISFTFDDVYISVYGSGKVAVELPAHE